MYISICIYIYVYICVYIYIYGISPKRTMAPRLFKSMILQVLLPQADQQLADDATVRRCSVGQWGMKSHIWDHRMGGVFSIGVLG